MDYTGANSVPSETKNCELCGYSLKPETDIISHMTREHNFKMSHMCNKTVSCVENLKEKFRKYHEDIEELTPEERIAEESLNQMISEM